MGSLYLNVQDVKSYLSPITQADEIPVLSRSTINVFRQIVPTIPKSEILLRDVRPLNERAAQLKERVSALAGKKDNETFHKVMSLVTMAAWAVLVAAAIFNPFGAAITFAIVGTLAFGSLIAYTISWTRLEELNSNTKYQHEPYMVGIIATMTLGLAIPIHYLVGAFRGVADLEEKIASLQKDATTDDLLMKRYILTHYDSLHAKIGTSIHKYQDDLVKLQILNVRSRGEESANEELIATLKLAQQQLSANHAFYK